MKAIPAVYQNGVFQPLAPIDLPEATGVEVLLPGSPAEASAVAALQRTAGAWSNLAGADEIEATLDELRQSAEYREDA